MALRHETFLGRRRVGEQHIDISARPQRQQLAATGGHEPEPVAGVRALEFGQQRLEQAGVLDRGRDPQGERAPVDPSAPARLQDQEANRREADYRSIPHQG